MRCLFVISVFVVLSLCSVVEDQHHVGNATNAGVVATTTIPPSSLFNVTKVTSHSKLTSSALTTQATVMPARLVLYADGEFVEVLVGNPGRVLTLRVDRTLNRTLVLFSVPSVYSRSYSLYPQSQLGSELIYLGCNLLRVRTWFDSTAMRSDTRITHHGWLGLGALSDVWRLWHQVTFSRDTLMLGEYDWSTVRRQYRSFAMRFNRTAAATASVKSSSKLYTLRYQPDDEFTRIPPELFHRGDGGSTGHSDDTGALELDFDDVHVALYLEQHDFVSRLPSGAVHSALRKQRRGSTEISLGKHSLGATVSHENLAKEQRVVRPSFDMFAFGSAQPACESIPAILLTAILVYWFALVYGETEIRESKRGRRAIATILLFTLLCACVLVHLETYGLHVERYLHHHMAHCNEFDAESNDHSYERLLLILFFWWCVGVALSLNDFLLSTRNLTVWLSKLSRSGGARRTVTVVSPSTMLQSTTSNGALAVRRCVVETILFTLLWLVQLNKHGYYEHLTLLVLVSFHATLRLVEFLRVLTDPTHYRVPTQLRNSRRRRSSSSGDVFSVESFCHCSVVMWLNNIPRRLSRLSRTDFIQLFILALGVCWSLYFSWIYTVSPFHQRFWYRFPHPTLASFYIVSTCIFLPTLFCVLNIQIGRTRQTLLSLYKRPIIKHLE